MKTTDELLAEIAELKALGVDSDNRAAEAIRSRDEMRNNLMAVDYALAALTYQYGVEHSDGWAIDISVKTQDAMPKGLPVVVYRSAYLGGDITVQLMKEPAPTSDYSSPAQ